MSGLGMRVDLCFGSPFRRERTASFRVVFFSRLSKFFKQQLAPILYYSWGTYKPCVALKRVLLWVWRFKVQRYSVFRRIHRRKRANDLLWRSLKSRNLPVNIHRPGHGSAQQYQYHFGFASGNYRRKVRSSVGPGLLFQPCNLHGYTVGGSGWSEKRRRSTILTKSGNPNANQFYRSPAKRM